MDYYLVAFPIGFLIGIVAPFILELPEVVVGMILLPIYAIIEAVLLSTWGYTPGKWLLKVKVRTEAGERLTLSESFKRSFSAIFYGLGLGIPIVGLITNVSSFEQLKDTGFTKWDKAGGFEVAHGQIGILRISCYVCLCAMFFYITVIGV